MAWVFKDNNQITYSGKKKTILAVGNVQSGKTRFMCNEIVESLLNGFDIAVVIGGTNNLLLGQTYERFIRDVQSKGFIVRQIRDGFLNRMADGSKVVITSLKHVDSLEKIVKTINNFPGKKIIVFDDESDFGSINIGKQNLSRVHLKIKEIQQSIINGIYVSLTATPFADILSKSAFDFDEYIKIIPGDGYTGVSEFNLINNYIETERISASSIFSIIKDHIARIMESKMTTTQLLINDSLMKREHTAVEKWTKSSISIIESNPLPHFIGLKNEDISMIKKICSELVKNTFVINQESSDWSNKGHSIIIGGALISRGYTFENLLTAVVSHSPKNKIAADTLLQRARWFGYRKHIKFMKIYLTPKLITAYKEVEVLNKMLFSTNEIDDLKNKIEALELEHIAPTGKV